MKLIHLSDLHIGKKVNEFSMKEDQEYILTKILNIIDKEKPDAVMIAGDVYDKSVPSEDAIKVWDNFLLKLASKKVTILAISGNHDSAIRFSTYNKLIETAGIYLASGYDGSVEPVVLKDKDGEVNFYMLPFIKPAIVRSFFPDEEINDYTDACRVAIDKMNIDKSKRNVIIAHQFVIGASRCESEEVSVGGLDGVSSEVFEDFDYVALGHIHGKQFIGRETIRYCGTPLKYSFSEKDHKKTVTIVEMGPKGSVEIREELLIPKHDMRQIKGTYEELTYKPNYENTATGDYIHAVLTDEEDVLDAMSKLRFIYPNIMKLSYDNKRTRENQDVSDAGDIDNKTPIELFEEFYEKQNNQPLSDTQKNFVVGLMESIWEG